MAIWDLINVHVKKALVKMERRYELRNMPNYTGQGFSEEVEIL